MVTHKPNAMKKVIQLHQTTPEQLVQDILLGVKGEIESLKKDFRPQEPEEYLTRSEVSKMLKVDLSTVHHWTKSGRLRRYGLGRRVYYKRSDIEQSLLEITPQIH
ncbi:helix-turn-helix domain-containing protein [Gramella sp. AN32]|uniref:Helix-turn-helix domain-containing protein n=1 Tax=Christiangramia antarctica TaxID=2058158 RepID=A0ABW5X6L3_9FLAO|nr:helix-turn-helix domain-containing protein [Gramella sp. AN32]